MENRASVKRGLEYYTQLPYSILLHEVEEDGEKYWIAEIPELAGCKSHGKSVEEVLSNVEDAKKEWIEDSLEHGDEVPTPIERERFGGKVLVRMSRSLHKSLTLSAEYEKLSLNQLIVTILAKEVGRLGVLNRVEEKLDSMINQISDSLVAARPNLISYAFIPTTNQPAGYLAVGTDIEMRDVELDLEQGLSAHAISAGLMHSADDTLWAFNNWYARKPCEILYKSKSAKAKEREIDIK